VPDFQHGRGTRVYVNGFDISAFLRSISSPVTVETTETTTLVNEFKSYIPSMADATISAEGLYEGSPDALNAIFEDAIVDGEPSVWLVTHGRRPGSPCYGMAARETSIAIETPATDLATFNIEGQSSSYRENGNVLHGLVSEGGAELGTPLDFGRPSPVGGAVYLQVTKAPDGVTTAEAMVAAQHSVDGITWVDLHSWTIPTAGPFAARVNIPFQINRYTRATWAAGASPSAPFLLAVTRRPA
jgi:hypothetical protein